MELHPLLKTTALVALLAAALGGCATRAVDVAPVPANPAEFMTWDCVRIDDERDRVQQRATDVAWSVDERVGNNILALGVGVMVFWPALFAMRPDGLEAADLARLKGRYEALARASHDKGCPPPPEGPSPSLAAVLPIAVGERLVYEDRTDARGPALEWKLAVTALRRGETEYRGAAAGAAADGDGLWLQDRSGNIVQAPDGALLWPRLLRADVGLGAVTAGEIRVVGDPMARARMRGQVVAVGPQSVAGRHFDAAVVELFGDALRGDASTRVDGVIVIDRVSGVLLRLDLRSAHGSFSLQRRLVRVEPAG
ncbi:MAG: hypothetical protein C0505_19270 [Leptothrix sp. (in: Bacteria)]|nr:hypothetical protein [Leptothrix sp. (in: b-proteobacteria)]